MAGARAKSLRMQDRALALAGFAKFFRDFAHPVECRKSPARIVPCIGGEQERSNQIAGFVDDVGMRELRTLDYEGLFSKSHAVGLPHEGFQGKILAANALNRAA